MGVLTDTIKNFYNNIEKISADYKKELADEINKASKESDSRMYLKFGLRQADYIQSIFNKTIEEFYNDHNGDHSGRGSLYDIVSVNYFVLNKDSTIDYDPISKLYNTDAVPGREGKDVGLYERVFVQGWHGGAPGGRKHPKPGTPYYRAPKDKWWRWSRPAGKSPSPKKKFEERLIKAEGNEIFNIFEEEAEAEWKIFTEEEVPNIISRVQEKYFKGMM